MPHLGQPVIGLEGVGLHDPVARPNMCRQGDGDRRVLPMVVATALECQTHRVRMRHIALERLDDGGIELAGPRNAPTAGPGSR